MSQHRTRRTFLASAATAASIATIGQGSASSTGSTDVTFLEEFDGTERDWYVRKSLSRPGTPGDWSVSLTRPESLSTPAVEFVADGRYSRGIAWAYTPISIEPGTAFDGSVSAEAWSPAVCDHPYTRLHMYVGPTEPTSADVFPAPTKTDSPEGESGGLNSSLWQTSGWTDYEFRWKTPTLDTDTLYLAVGVSTIANARFAHYLDSIDVDLRTRSTDTDTIWEGVSMETVELSEVPRDNPSLSVDQTTGNVSVTGDMTVPTPCHDPIILNSYYNHTTDQLVLVLSSSDVSSPNEVCTQQLVDKGYQATASFSGGLPSTVQVFDGQESYTLEV